MATHAPFFNTQFVDNDGALAAGHLLYTFESGTSTEKDSYTDQAGTVENANPIVLDAAGRCTLWLGSGEYAFELRTPADALVKRWDDVSGVPVAGSSDYVPIAGGVTMTGLFELSGDAQAALQPTTLQQVQSLIAAAISAVQSGIAEEPIGTITLWLKSTAPSADYLELNGNNVLRADYPALFSLWGTTFGNGDGSTTFGLPDVRGYAVRAWDHGRGIDSGRAIGDTQADEIKAHVHDDVLQKSASHPRKVTANRDSGEDDSSAIGKNTGTTTASTGGSETRMKNFSFMLVVKAR